MLHLRNPGRDEPSLQSEAFDRNGVRVEEVGDSKPYNRTMFFFVDTCLINQSEAQGWDFNGAWAEEVGDPQP